MSKNEYSDLRFLCFIALIGDVFYLLYNCIDFISINEFLTTYASTCLYSTILNIVLLSALCEKHKDQKDVSQQKPKIYEMCKISTLVTYIVFITLFIIMFSKTIPWVAGISLMTIYILLYHCFSTYLMLTILNDMKN